MKAKFKHAYLAVMAAAFLIFVFLGAHTVFADAAYVYYESASTQTLTKGVTYQAYNQITSKGLRNIYLLSVPLDDPNISVAPAESTTEYGLKETVRNLLTENSAIAGVNADFFGVNGNYSAGFGPVVSDGQLNSLNTVINSPTETDRFASFYIPQSGNPFFSFLTSKIIFKVDGKPSFDVPYKNKITDMLYPTWIDDTAMQNTADLDARFPNLCKLIVENGVIVRLSAPGETVDVPHDGFLIVMQQSTTQWYHFTPGQTAEIHAETSVDLSKIETAIGGGGEFLQNGQPVSYGYVATGLQPRTAIGLTADKKTLLIAVVDGRTDSVGATPEDMQNIMLRFGATDAMYMDGGGSSTMVVGDAMGDNLTTVNTPSDGAARHVINALGVFNNSEVGDTTSLSLVPDSDFAFVGDPIKLTLYALDDYLNKTPLDNTQAAFGTTDPTGSTENGIYYPGTPGTYSLMGGYGTLMVETPITVKTIAGITSSPASYKLGVGGTQKISLQAVSGDGYGKALDTSAFTFTVNPPDLGTVTDGVFTAAKNGAGYIQCSNGSFNYYIDVVVGYTYVALADQPTGVSFDSYPSGVTGSVSGDGEISYQFTPGLADTQAAYMVLNTPITLAKGVSALRLTVDPHGSNSWIRMNVTDANNKTYTLDVARTGDWTGDRDCDVTLPADAAYPLQITRIYAAGVDDIDGAVHSLRVTNLRGLYYMEYTGPAHPTNATPVDPWAAYLGDTQPSDFVFTGDLKADKIPSKYNLTSLTDAAVLTLTASNGNIFKDDPSQWTRMSKDLSAAPQKNIIIVLNKDPRKFAVGSEADMLQNFLLTLSASGKNIIVVSEDGSAPSRQTAVEGIRYINVNGQRLTLRVNADGMRFEMK